MGAAAHILIRLKRAPENRMNPQRREIIRRDDTSRGDLGPVANAERGAHNLAYKERVKQFAVPLQIEEIGPGKRGTVSLSRSRQSQQPLLVRNRRVGAEQKSLHPTENGGVGADTQSQAKNRHKGKAGTAAQHPQGEAKILKQGFKERESAGLAASLRGRKTALKILFDSEFQMSGHFRVEFTILPGAAEQRAQAMEPLTNLVDHLLSLPSGRASTRPITSESRCQ